jgi:hypothetical protein
MRTFGSRHNAGFAGEARNRRCRPPICSSLTRLPDPSISSKRAPFHFAGRHPAMLRRNQPVLTAPHDQHRCDCRMYGRVHAKRATALCSSHIRAIPSLLPGCPGLGINLVEDRLRPFLWLECRPRQKCCTPGGLTNEVAHQTQSGRLSPFADFSLAFHDPRPLACEPAAISAAQFSARVSKLTIRGDF